MIMVNTISDKSKSKKEIEITTEETARMPIYEYVCDNCKKMSTHKLSIGERNAKVGTVCEDCNEGKLRRTYNCNFRLMAPDQLGRVKPPSDWRNFVDGLKR